MINNNTYKQIVINEAAEQCRASREMLIYKYTHGWISKRKYEKLLKRIKEVETQYENECR